MDINLTLIIQMFVFLAFVFFTMKWVWPPLSKALEERRDKIADGIAAAERGRQQLEIAEHRVKETLKQARAEATQIVENASKRAEFLIEEAKIEARKEADKQIKIANEQFQIEVHRAKESLRQETGALVIQVAEKILNSTLNQETNQKLIDQFMKEMA